MEFKDLMTGMVGDYHDTSEAASRIAALSRFTFESKRRNAPMHPNDIIAIMGFKNAIMGYKEEEASAADTDLIR